MAEVSVWERRWVRFAAPPLLFGFAFAVRCVSIHEVLVEGRTLFFGTDAYYHMRRIAYSIVHFPKVLDFDPYINHPHGGEPIWTPLFDWVSAAILLPVWRIAGEAAVERAAVFLPPLLGAATVVVLVRLARRHFGTPAALLAGGILSLLSGHVWYSQVGFVDHHAAVALVSTVTLAAAMRLVTTAEATGEPPRGATIPAIGTGFWIGVSLLLWPGCLLHVALIEIGLGVFALTRRDREVAIDFAWCGVLLHGVAFALVAPFAVGAHWESWGRFSPVVLSHFQPWLLGVGAAFAAACAGIWRFDPLGKTPAARLGSALVAALAILLVVAERVPESIATLADAWQWLATEDDFQGLVAESAPLFLQDGRFTWMPAIARLSAFFPLLPVAIAVGAIRALRSRDPAPQLLAFGWCFGLALVTCFQRRFINSSSVGVALLFALALVWSYRFLVTRLPRHPRAGAAVAVALAGSILLSPVLVFYGWYIENGLRSLGGDPVLSKPQTWQRAAVVEMAHWMRTATPAPSRWLDAERRPSWGVMAPWTIGHVLEYEARRPTVTDNFGDDLGRENFLAARRYYLSTEPEAAAILERLSVRYVVAQPAPNYLGADPEPGSMFATLFGADGSERSKSGGVFDRRTLPGLSRHRLVFDARPLMGTDRTGAPAFKVFEFVPGARLVGEAAPGAWVRAQLGVRSNRGRGFVYAVSTQSSAVGRYELVVPYATQGGPQGIRVDPYYEIVCSADRGRVAVAERAVRRGEPVAGPSLCRAPRGGQDASPTRAQEEP